MILCLTCRCLTKLMLPKLLGPLVAFFFISGPSQSPKFRSPWARHFYHLAFMWKHVRPLGAAMAYASQRSQRHGIGLFFFPGKSLPVKNSPEFFFGIGLPRHRHYWYTINWFLVSLGEPLCYPHDILMIGAHQPRLGNGPSPPWLWSGSASTSSKRWAAERTVGRWDTNTLINKIWGI